MKKWIPGLLLFVTACAHTQEENYAMIDKVTNEMRIIKDSIQYLDSSIMTNLPAAWLNIEEDTSKGTRFRKFYADSLTRTPDSVYGKMMSSHNRLQERFFTYQDIYKHVYKRLPKDSAKKNEQLLREFDKISGQ